MDPYPLSEAARLEAVAQFAGQQDIGNVRQAVTQGRVAFYGGPSLLQTNQCLLPAKMVTIMQKEQFTSASTTSPTLAHCPFDYTLIDNLQCCRATIVFDDQLAWQTRGHASHESQS